MASGAGYGFGDGAAVDADARAVQSGPEDADGVVGAGGKVVEIIGAIRVRCFIVSFSPPQPRFFVNAKN